MSKVRVLEMIRRIEWFYECVACQALHYECEPLYAAHVFRQSKHGLRVTSRHDHGYIPVGVGGSS